MTQVATPSPTAAAKPPATTRAAPDAIDLPAGRSFQPDESMVISGARPTRFVVLAGAAESGKTTLLASLHERFLRGPWAGYLFAGNATLHGFERICYEGRGISEGPIPATQRTKRSQGRQLLHLRVRVEDCSRPAQDVLLSDLSGEEFDDARHSTEEARALSIVRSAHYFALLVDGAKLADITRRQEARDEPSLLLRTFVEEGMLGATSRIHLVFTKWDVVGADPAKAETEPFAKEIADELIQRYAGKFAEFEVFQVSARDPKGSLPPANGLEGAFAKWAQNGQAHQAIPQPPMIETVGAVEYDRFLRRRMPELFAGAAL